MTLSRSTRRPVSAGLVALTFVVIAAATPPTTSLNDRATPSEVRWVRAHLDSVLRELPRHDVRGLSSTQLANRVHVLATLQSYRDAGEFPRNYDFADPTPYFADRKTGSLCAVGYLLASTGRRDIVERLARGNNNVRVRELAGDTALASWLVENGLTLEEAARIQVVYATSPSADIGRIATLAATPFALAGSVVSGAWNSLGNADGHRVTPGVIGIASGLASIGLAAELSAARGVPKSSGLIMAGVGTASIALAVRSLVHRHDTAAAIRSEQKTIVIHDMQILPTIALNNGGAPGFSVSMRF